MILLPLLVYAFQMPLEIVFEIPQETSKNFVKQKKKLFYENVPKRYDYLNEFKNNFLNLTFSVNFVCIFFGKF